MPYRLLIYSLIASVILVLILIWALLLRIRINRHQNNRNPWTFFLPVLIGALLTYLLLFEVQPRFLDVLDLCYGNVGSLTLSGEHVQVDGRRLNDRKNVYLLPPGMTAPEKGKTYRLLYARRTKMVFELDDIEQLSKKMGGVAP